MVYKKKCDPAAPNHSAIRPYRHRNDNQGNNETPLTGNKTQKHNDKNKKTTRENKNREQYYNACRSYRWLNRVPRIAGFHCRRCSHGFVAHFTTRCLASISHCYHVLYIVTFIIIAFAPLLPLQLRCWGPTPSPTKPPTISSRAASNKC